MKRIALLLALLLCLSACSKQDQETTVTTDTAAADSAETPAEDAAPAEETAPAEDTASAEDTAPAEDAETPAEETEAPAVESKAVVEAPVITSQQYDASAAAEDGTTVLTTSYPAFTVTGAAGEALTAALNADVEEYKALTEHGVSGESESLEADAQEGYRMSQEDGYPWDAPYTDELTATVVRCDERVVCVCFTSYTYTGGVHGFSYNFGRCYNAQTGERLTLETLAADGVNLQEYALSAVLELSRDGEKYEQDMFFEGYEEDLSSVVDDEFLLDDNGLTFSAAPYELAAYAYGVIDFTIPYDQLTGVVQAQYLPNS